MTVIKISGNSCLDIIQKMIREELPFHSTLRVICEEDVESELNAVFSVNINDTSQFILTSRKDLSLAIMRF